MIARETIKVHINMGMAASQARLLTLTSRLHDVEYKAQNIESQKIALATQKDELYQDYCDALDAKKIQVAYSNGDGTRSFVDATFATLCTYNENRFAQYSLTDSKTGKVIVDSKTAEIYENFSSDKYTFAYAMLGMEGDFAWPVDNDTERMSMGMEVGIGISGEDYGDGTAENGLYNLYMTDVERKVYENHSTEDKLQKAYNSLTEACNSDSTSMKEKREALENFREVLYDNYGSEIYKYMRLNKNDVSNTDPDSATAEFNDVPEEFPQQEFNFYANLFEKIQAAGGCQEIEPDCEAGEKGNEWLNNMVNSGRVTIDVYNTNKKEWTETSIATSTNTNYLQEVQDEADLKKAEAKYEYELGVINDKDSKYDRDLSKLETERTSITTEMESIQKVRDDNIERTFGIFS